MRKRIFWLFLGLAMVSSLMACSVAAAVTFTAPELLGRPTATAVTVNVVATSALDAYFQYGMVSGKYTARTATVTSAAGTPGPGDYDGVHVYHGASTESEFRSCDFAYGGQGGGLSSLLYVDDCHPVITGCDFGYSAGWGITLRTAQATDLLQMATACLRTSRMT